MTGSDRGLSILKYVGLFALTYYLFLVAIAVLLAVIKVDMTGVFYAIAILGAGRVPVYKFLKENSRLYTKVEKRKLIAGTFLCTLIINILNTADMIGEMSMMHLGYSFLVGQVLDLLILWYIFGPFSKNIYKSTAQ